MSEVQGSTAAGSASRASPPSTSGTGGAYSDAGGPLLCNGAAGATSAPGPSSSVWSEAGMAAVQSSFQSAPPDEVPLRQPPPLFRDGPIDLSDSAATSWATSTSNASLAPTSSTALAPSDTAQDADEAARRFDEFLASNPQPDDVRQFFEGLSPVERERIADERPETIGGLDGAPAALRDRANRRLMEQDLDHLEAGKASGTLNRQELRALENIRAVEESIAKIVGEPDPDAGGYLVAQLYLYEPFAFGGDGRAAVTVGDLDDADHVAVMVSGLGARVADMNGDSALNVYRQSRRASDDSVAVLDWVGYDAPSGGPFRSDVAGVVTQSMARAGAQRLATDVAGLQVMRGDTPTHLTVIGYSYGATTSAIVAHEFGLQADDLILIGSPGAGQATDAENLTTGRDHTWIGSASRDFVTSLGVTGWADPSQVLAAFHGIPPELLGADPAEDDFHAQRFQAESVDRGNGWNIDDHLSRRYYAEKSESLYNVASIVTGNYEEVLRAEPRHDPWYAPLQDPERKRAPQEIGY